MTVEGAGLDRGGRLYFSCPDVSATHVEKDRYQVTVARDAEFGLCDLWIATAEGLAGPHRFRVTSSPVVAEQERGDGPDTAQAIPIPAVVDGRLDKGTELDWYRFDGKQGQRLTIRCLSSSLDASVQPTLTLIGPTGQELAHSRAYQREPTVQFRLPAAGDYRLRVHERAYRQDNVGTYQLDIADGGTPQPAESPETLLIHPAELFADIAAVEEAKSSRSEPQSFEPPCRVAGRIESRGDVDWYKFTAKKGAELHVEAFGERLGQRMDLEADIYDEAGKLVSSISDAAAPKGLPATLPLASLDPAANWKAPADGAYHLAIRDLYGGSVFGPDRVYELVVEPVKPRFVVFALPAANKPGQGSFLRPNGKARLDLTVLRLGGFAGSVTVDFEQPVGGLTLEPCTIGAKEVTKQLVVSAAADSSARFVTCQLVARSRIGGQDHQTIVTPLCTPSTGSTRPTDGLLVYISE